MLLLQAFMALGNLEEQRLGSYSLCNLNPLPINYWCNDFHLHQWQVEHGLLTAGSKVLLILLAEACDTHDLFPSKLNYEPKFIPALLMAEVTNFAQNTWSPFFQKKTREWVWGHILFHLLSIGSHGCALQKQAFHTPDFTCYQEKRALSLHAGKEIVRLQNISTHDLNCI